MRTPLYDEHLRLGARVTEFAGWEMPLQYGSIAREVASVRTKAGIFDLCHMGEIIISGPSALDLIQYVSTNDASRISLGRAQYSLICDDDGGIIDDVIIYRIEDETYLLIVNASNTQTDYDWICTHNRFGALVKDESADTALLAVQGPESRELLGSLTDTDLESLPRFAATKAEIGEVDCLVARTGYTGEDGFELVCTASECRLVWNQILAVGEAVGARPVGLAARDVLRLEAGYPLHGHELSRNILPVSARLMWVVKLSKGEFVGRDAISRAAQEGPDRLLIGLKAADACIPRAESVVIADGASVGEVTSGTFSPTLGKGIALAYVQAKYAEIGGTLEAVMGSRRCSCSVIKPPFYTSKSLESRGSGG